MTPTTPKQSDGFSDEESNEQEERRLVGDVFGGRLTIPLRNPVHYEALGGDGYVSPGRQAGHPSTDFLGGRKRYRKPVYTRAVVCFAIGLSIFGLLLVLLLPRHISLTSPSVRAAGLSLLVLNRTVTLDFNVSLVVMNPNYAPLFLSNSVVEVSFHRLPSRTQPSSSQPPLASTSPTHRLHPPTTPPRSPRLVLSDDQPGLVRLFTSNRTADSTPASVPMAVIIGNVVDREEQSFPMRSLGRRSFQVVGKLHESLEESRFRALEDAFQTACFGLPHAYLLSFSGSVSAKFWWVHHTLVLPPFDLRVNCSLPAKA